jgi:murein L,D-transpeptidase YafK
MKKIITLIMLVIPFILKSEDLISVDEIRVYKSKHRMELIANNQIVKTFKVVLGRGGKAPKRIKNDHKVPEGLYTIDYKNPDSLFYKSLHISYPNEEDQRRAAEAGVDPGGDIMIHGYPNKLSPFFKFLKKLGLMKMVDWTAGCVAVNDKEMEAIFQAVELNTPVRIFH